MYGFVYWTVYLVVLFGGAILIGLGLNALFDNSDITTLAQLVAGAIWGWAVTTAAIEWWD